MKLIIAGSRDIVVDSETISYWLKQHSLIPSAIISGRARGADISGEKWARDNRVEVLEYPADWDRFGKAAGIFRNREMAQVGDKLLVFWDGKSRGTKNMIDEMKRLDKEVFIVIL